MRSGKCILKTTRTTTFQLLVAVMVVLCLFLSTAEAATVYVGDEIKLTVRSGPAIDRKILDIVSTGEKMDILEDGEEWVFIRLSDGKEGWVLKRYLSSERPSKLKLADLQKKHGSLATRSDELAEENEALKASNEKITRDLQEKTKALEELTRSHEELQQDADASSFQMRKYLVFFFSGAGILFIGILLGVVMKRQRRKSMYMI
jgi:SH3 domain protein